MLRSVLDHATYYFMHHALLCNTMLCSTLCQTFCDSILFNYLLGLQLQGIHNR